MIFPGNVFNKEIKIDLNPAWVLLSVNVLIFAFIQLFFGETIKSYKSDVYQNKISKLADMYKQTLDPLELKKFDESNTFAIVRDAKFWSRSQTFPFKGDQIKIAEARLFLAELKSDYYNSPQYIFGLSPAPTSVWAWLTYQFLHTNFFHLTMNMIFLFLIVAVLQKKIDPDWIYSVYVFSGLGGGYAYLMMNEFNEIAVVGASGAICGLMSFMSVAFYSKNIEWSYFLAPFKGFYGIIYMPAFIVFPVYLVSDFTTILSYEFGLQSSVAHSAHIGGTLVGFVLGVLYLFDQRFKKNILTKWGHHLSLAQYSELRDRVK